MSKTSDLPEAIAAWPALPPDLLSASIQPADTAGEQDASAPENLHKSDDPKVNSILVVADNAGRIHCFLDGSYPLGAISVGASSTTASLQKDPLNPVLFAHQCSQISGTTLLPTRVELPLLGTRLPRDLARISTTSRELLWYAMRVLDEMHAAWLGSGTQIGAREPGIRWLKSLDDLQVQMGACMPSVIILPRLRPDTSPAVADSTTSLLDLTLLLLVGRSSEAASDYIGSGEQMSERVGGSSIVTSAMVQGYFVGTTKMGIDSDGSPGTVARFFRITRCPSMPAPSLIVRRDLGLVSSVSVLCVIASRSLPHRH
jgi:anaphase-promoting complex subunit 4